MRGVQIYYAVIAIVVTLLAIMMMANWPHAPRGIRVMAQKLGAWRIPAGLVLIAISALLVFGQRF